MLLVLGLVAGGCGGDDASDSSPSPSACTDVMALQESVTALTQVDPVNDGVDALKSAAATVKTDLETALSAVSSELKPAVDQVKTAFDGLEIALEGVSSGGGLGAAATEIGTAMTQGRERVDEPVDGGGRGLLAVPCERWRGGPWWENRTC